MSTQNYRSDEYLDRMKYLITSTGDDLALDATREDVVEYLDNLERKARYERVAKLFPNKLDQIAWLAVHTPTNELTSI